MRKKSADNANEEEEVEEETEVEETSTKKKGARRKKKREDSEESSHEDTGNSSDEESAAEGSDKEYDLSAYESLIGETYYDPDDKAVFKISSVTVSDDGDVVVYRCKYNQQTRKWCTENKNHCFHVQDIINCKDNLENQAKMNAVLRPAKKKLKKK